MKLTISRRIWGRGRTGGLLLGELDGRRQCCVGIYLSALGLPDGLLAGVSSGHHVEDGRVPRWLISYNNAERCSADARDLYEINDDEDLDEPGREISIAAIFARHGVEVTFVD